MHYLLFVDQKGFVSDFFDERVFAKYTDNAVCKTKSSEEWYVNNGLYSFRDFNHEYSSSINYCLISPQELGSIPVHSLIIFRFVNIEIKNKLVKVQDGLLNSFKLQTAARDQELNVDILQYKRTYLPNEEECYLKMLEKVMGLGNDRPDRTGTGTISIFGEQIRFDISNNIPLLTTKNVPWRLVIEELLWFMRGETDSKILEAKNVNIWKGNSSREFLDKRGLHYLPEGDIGCGYGFQWRHFGGRYVDCRTKYDNVGFDQLQCVIDQLTNDPYSRRILMTAWNAKDLHYMALPPCHNQVQFYVSEIPGSKEKYLSCHMYQRSVDTFLGFPWNILSYSVLTYILATKCGMLPKELIISTGDTHIYKDHIDQVKQQLLRNPLPFPKLNINPNVKNKEIEEITIDDFEILGYFSHPTINAKMSV